MPVPDTPGSLLLPILVFLAAAVVAVPTFRLLGLGAVIGYLAAGVAIGPHGLAVVGASAATTQVAELGVVLLLFLIGLELNPSRALAMRRDMALLGGLQMATCSLAIGMALWLGFGLDPRGAALAGVALSFSGTAVALQILEERGAVNSAYGRRAFAVLIFQDILVVPVLAAAPLLAGAAALGNGDWRDGLLAFAASLGVIAAVVIAGRYAINPLFGLLARLGAREVMTAAALLVVLGAALAMSRAGLSMALGAFLAGLLLSESHFRHQLQADIEPFRGLLMGLFFMSVGMSLDTGLVAASASGLAAATLGVLAVKAALVYALMRATGSNRCESVSGGAALTSAGEFSFVIFPLAAAAGLVAPAQAALLTAVAALTMVAGPLLASALDRLAERLRRPDEAPPAEAPPEGLQGSVLVVGFGRFGQMAVQVLLAGRVDVTVIDRDVERIRNAARFGFKVYYGDGARLDVLRAAGAGQARVIAVCVDDPAQADRIVEMCKAEFPLAMVHARAYDRIHALRLVERGVDAFTRETFESALAFGAAALEAISDDAATARDIMADVRQRDFQRLALQQAGGAYVPAASHAGAPPVQPEPLTRPARAARALTQETRQIVDTPDSQDQPTSRQGSS